MKNAYAFVSAAATLSIVFAAYGCSSSSSGDTGGGSTDGGGGGGDGSVGGGDGGGGGDGSVGGGKTYQGSVTLGSSAAIAEFQKAATGGTPSCVTTMGSCKLINCPIDADAGDVPTYSAGDITVTGGQISTSLVLSFDPDGGVYGQTLASSPFNAGDTLHVSAAGADVTAFSGPSGAAPGTIALTAPTGTGTPGFLAYTIDTTQDLTVTWTGGQAGTKLAFDLSNVDDESTDLTLHCEFDAAGGTGTVPTALMSQLGSPASGSLSASDISTVNVDSSNATVLFQLAGDPTIGTWTKQ